MCDTKLRERSYSGEKIGDFLREAIMPTMHPPQAPSLTVPTLQRLMGHIDLSWVDQDVIEMLDNIQGGEPGPSAVDQLVAPAFRSAEDFLGHASLVILVASTSSNPWKKVDAPIVDTATGKIHMQIDGLGWVVSDPRDPTVWTEEDYDLIFNRTAVAPADPIARIASALINLSSFSANPLIEELDIASALNQLPTPTV
jgi:hypothetical protein